MAETAHKNDEDKKEYFDPSDVLDKKIAQLAEFIHSSEHFIAFTGAGISTACGIPDFRSGVDTVLPTGPGAWEKKALNISPKPKLAVEMAKALPSYTHMSLIALEKKGLLKFLVSQNTDGLHLKSGFPGQKLAELHGNRNLEICRTCGRRFLRDFRTREAKSVFQHQTTRSCQNCGSTLYDSIINFGEKLLENELKDAFQHAGKADLCLAMGSSLTVPPACDIPKDVGVSGRLVIVNLQKTPLDGVATLKINALCDDVMRRLMDKLEIKPQEYRLQRYIRFLKKAEDVIEFRGVDSTGIPYTFLKSVDFGAHLEGESKKEKEFHQEPYVVKLEKGTTNLNVVLKFYGHYKEPDLKIELDTRQFEKNLILRLTYNPYQICWERVKLLDNEADKEIIKNIEVKKPLKLPGKQEPDSAPRSSSTEK